MSKKEILDLILVLIVSVSAFSICPNEIIQNVSISNSLTSILLVILVTMHTPSRRVSYEELYTLLSYVKIAIVSIIMVYFISITYILIHTILHIMKDGPSK